MSAALDHSMTTTAFALDGYRTTKTLGVVRGVTVRSRSILGTIGASLQTLVGGNITLYTQLCEKAREDAYQLMLEHAAENGANAEAQVEMIIQEIHKSRGPSKLTPPAIGSRSTTNLIF